MNVGRLVKKAKSGDKEALLQLIMAEKDAYYRLSYTYMRNPHDAMDAMEDMIVRIYEKVDQLKDNKAFYSWSKTILVNSCKAMLMKRNKVVLVENWSSEEPKAHEHPYSMDPILNREQQVDLSVLLNHINEQQREAIQLKYFQDMDYQTIAEITNVSVGTVKSRVFQGLKRLRELVGGDQDE